MADETDSLSALETGLTGSCSAGSPGDDGDPSRAEMQRDHDATRRYVAATLRNLGRASISFHRDGWRRAPSARGVQPRDLRLPRGVGPRLLDLCVRLLHRVRAMEAFADHCDALVRFALDGETIPDSVVVNDRSARMCVLARELKAHWEALSDATRARKDVRRIFATSYGRLLGLFAPLPVYPELEIGEFLYSELRPRGIEKSEAYRAAEEIWRALEGGPRVRGDKKAVLERFDKRRKSRASSAQRCVTLADDADITGVYRLDLGDD
jgi:hypothetical protein